jgi:hypothetical protein
MPLAHLKVGSIASDRLGLLIADPKSEQWGRLEWVERERIISFVGQPLVSRNDTLGVLEAYRDRRRAVSVSQATAACSS